MLPKTYGDRLAVNTRHEASDGVAALMKAIDGRTRGLPSADVRLLPDKTETGPIDRGEG